jgi:hypothetical protein
LANIGVMRDSVARLGEILDALKYRVRELADERATGTFTAECSRSDLLAIADRLPPLDQWRAAVFDEAKAAITADFGLSSTKFSAAVTAIKSSRETCRRIGQLTDLTHLTDKHLIYAIEQWKRCHPRPPTTEGFGLDFGVSRGFEAMAECHAVEKDVIEAIIKTLDLDEIADLEAVYQVGRLNQYAERYDEILKLACERRRLAGDDLWQAVHYLVTKTNLKTSVACGLFLLGRPDLGEKVEAIGHGASQPA